MSVSEFTTTTTARDWYYCKQLSRTPTASYITCQVTMAGYAAAAQVCMVIHNLADVLSPTHPRSPSDLLVVHAVCHTHTVSVADR